jgi:hypothetical protein
MRRFVPLHHVRRDFALGKLANRAAKVLLLVSEREFQCSSV